MATALVWDLIANDRASGTFTKVGAAAEVSSDLVGKLTKALGVAAAVDLGAKLVKEAAGFQRAMLLIQTQAGASAQEVQNLSGKVLNLAGSVGEGPEQLATSLYHVESIGLRAGAAMDAVRIAAEGAKVGNADLEETTNALTSTVASGIPGVESLSKAMGALNTIVGSGDMKLSDLNEALGTGGLSVLKSYGLSLNDVGAALATLGDNNVRGAEAMTDVRMAVQAMAVPAVEGRKRLAELGLAADTLAKDMQEGGLNKALLDLKGHLDSAGVSGVQAGATLTEVFGKKAGPGLGVLIGQVDRFETKLADVKAGADNFDSAWKATTQSVGFQFDRLRSQLEADGVKLGTALLPATSALLHFFSDELPADVGRLQHAFLPLEQELRGPLTAAFGAGIAVIKLADDALTDLTRLLDEHRGTVAVVGATVLGMWAAYKGYQVAVSAGKALASAFETVQLKAMYARDAVAGVSESTVTSGIALGGLGVVLGGATYLWQKHEATIAANKQQFQELTQAIIADNGAIGDNARAVAAKTLSDNGALGIARKLGLSLKDTEDAALGSDAALDRLNDQMSKLGPITSNTDARQKLIGILESQAKNSDGAIQKAKNIAEAEGKSADSANSAADATSNLAAQMAANYTVVNGVTVAMDGQTTAADSLASALSILSGNSVSAQQANLAFKDGLDTITAQIKSNAQSLKGSATSLDENTEAGRKNQEWLLSQITLANQHAQAVEKQTGSIDDATAALFGDEDALRKAALAAGLNKDQVDALITKYEALPKDVKTTVTADTNQAQAALDAVSSVIHTINGQKVSIPISVLDATLGLTGHGEAPTPGKASGDAYWGGGTLWAGENGPERITLPKGSKIDSAQASKAPVVDNEAVVVELQGLRADLARLTVQHAQSVDQSVRGAAQEGARTSAFLAGRTSRVDQ